MCPAEQPHSNKRYKIRGRFLTKKRFWCPRPEMNLNSQRLEEPFALAGNTINTTHDWHDTNIDGFCQWQLASMNVWMYISMWIRFYGSIFLWRLGGLMLLLVFKQARPRLDKQCWAEHLLVSGRPHTMIQSIVRRWIGGRTRPEWRKRRSATSLASGQLSWRLRWRQLGWWGGRLQVHLSQQSVLLNWSSMLESCACNRGGKLLAEWQQNIRQLTNHQEMYPDRMIRLTNGSYQIFGIGRKTSEFSHKLSFSTNRTIKIKKLVSTFKIFETIPNFE